MSYPNEYRYTKDHEWVKIEEGRARIGITDHAQHELGDVGGRRRLCAGEREGDRGERSAGERT